MGSGDLLHGFVSRRTGTGFNPGDLPCRQADDVCLSQAPLLAHISHRKTEASIQDQPLHSDSIAELGVLCGTNHLQAHVGIAPDPVEETPIFINREVDALIFGETSESGHIIEPNLK